MRWFRRWFDSLGKKSEPAMIATFEKEAGGVYILRFGGVLNKATLDRFQSIASQDFARGVTGIKVLVVLTAFRGWHKGDEWGDLDFFARYEKHIARIALVCEAQWEAPTSLFIAAGHRSGAVKRFAPDDEAGARAWLMAP